MNPLRTWYYSQSVFLPPRSVVVSRLPGFVGKAVKVNAKSSGQTLLIFISAPLAMISSPLGEKETRFSVLDIEPPKRCRAVGITVIKKTNGNL